ncbi:MAG: hypothetical protein KDC98_16175 [Planctomycetes bacterium]|nr:hypothetical protein [Planctomycetota bacterium]
MKTQLVLALVTAGLGSCAARPYPAFGIEDGTEPIDHVVVSEASLQDVVQVGRPQIERVADGGARVVLVVHNGDIETIEVMAELVLLAEGREPVGAAGNGQVAVIGPDCTVAVGWDWPVGRDSGYEIRLSWNK